MSENMTEGTTTERNARKVREGLVTSNAMDKTVIVTVTERVRHKKYSKTLRAIPSCTCMTKPMSSTWATAYEWQKRDRCQS